MILQSHLSSTVQLRAALAADLTNARDGLAAALYQEGQQIMAKAQRRVPVRYGALRRSGIVIPPGDLDAPGAITVHLGFGGDAAPYAVIVHENLQAYHKAPTSAKYLEIPAHAAVDGMGERLARRVQAFMARRRGLMKGLGAAPPPPSGA